MYDEVKCSLVPRTEYIILNRGKTKSGRYLSSCFWDVPEYGSKKWAVGVYIRVDDQSLLDRLNTNEIASGCLKYLNTPPKRKKYGKKQPEPKYGTLELYSAKVVEKNDETLISAVVLTAQRKNRQFWGKGINV
tara:strand:- start:920 stop:1318 length:399 start_codon:yes stop_codon:yes gene_type:complete